MSRLPGAGAPRGATAMFLDGARKGADAPRSTPATGKAPVRRRRRRVGTMRSGYLVQGRGPTCEAVAGLPETCQATQPDTDQSKRGITGFCGWVHPWTTRPKGELLGAPAESTCSCRRPDVPGDRSRWGSEWRCLAP